MYPPCATSLREIPFFRRVIADLNDSQTLELDGGLSTFGAHLKGLQRILDTANDDSLILLDEPEATPIPPRARALAVAVLNALSRRSRLTVATSHYEEVKEFALASPACRVAAVEFDLNTLQPTYRLLWGETGRSNALHIAAGLGLAPSIIAEARGVGQGGRYSGDERQGRPRGENPCEIGERFGRGVTCSSRETRGGERDARKRRERSTTTSRRNPRTWTSRKQIIKERVESEASAQIEEARALFDACETKEDVDDAAEAHLPLMDRRRTASRPGNSPDEGATRRAFDVGDAVIVRQLGTAEAEVIDVHPETNEITVKLGRILPASRLLPAEQSGGCGKTSWRKEQRARRL